MPNKDDTITNMKDFANAMRLTSNFRKMIELAATEVKMDLTNEQFDVLAEMMVEHFDPFTERFLISLHERDEERAWEIAHAITAKEDSAISMMYEAATELIVLILANQALLYTALGGLEGDQDED
jgi:hypothetical protein